MQRLNERVALVTGGAAGLGRAIAHRLAEEGARIVISDIQTDLGEQTAQQLGALYLYQDVACEEGWERVIADIQDRYGGIDVLVNNAGILGPMNSVDPEHARLAEWRLIFSVNVESVFLGCRAAIRAMRRRGAGAIVNMSSVAGLLATPYATAYGASKAAVRQLTKSVAQYCAQQKLNIRCNSVHPGDVRTPLWDKYAQQVAAERKIEVSQYIAEELQYCPMGDFTRPEDVAAAVAFLVSDDARHVTGSQLTVDGGIVNCDTFRP